MRNQGKILAGKGNSKDLSIWVEEKGKLNKIGKKETYWRKIENEAILFPSVFSVEELRVTYTMTLLFSSLI